MRPMFAYSMLAAMLLAAACKQSEQQEAERRFEKAQERVESESREMRNAEDPPAGTASERTDAIDTARNVKRAEQQLAAARAQYKAEMERQLVRIDERIVELDAKGDETSRETAARLRKHRDEFAAKLQRLENEPPATWEHLKGETDDQLEQMKRESGEEL